MSGGASWLLIALGLLFTLGLLALACTQIAYDLPAPHELDLEYLWNGDDLCDAA